MGTEVREGAIILTWSLRSVASIGPNSQLLGGICIYNMLYLLLLRLQIIRWIFDHISSRVNDISVSILTHMVWTLSMKYSMKLEARVSIVLYSSSGSLPFLDKS